MKSENIELKKNIEFNLKKLEYTKKLIDKKEENDKNISEIKQNFNNQINLIIKEYENKIYEMKNYLYKQFTNYINKLKQEEEKRKKMYLSWEDKTKEINGFFNSTQRSHGINCNECNKEIKGIKYECSKCKNYNLCENCELINFLKQKHLHKFFKIRKPKRSIENEIKNIQINNS